MRQAKGVFYSGWESRQLESNKKRPLGIPAYEDKLVQAALAKILTAIYKPEFLNVSFGFRPNRGCHDAIKALNDVLVYRPINYIADVDIEKFSDINLGQLLGVDNIFGLVIK